MDCTKAATDANFDLANPKETLCVLKGLVSESRSAMHSAMRVVNTCNMSG